MMMKMTIVAGTDIMARVIIKNTGNVKNAGNIITAVSAITGNVKSATGTMTKNGSVRNAAGITTAMETKITARKKGKTTRVDK